VYSACADKKIIANLHATKHIQSHWHQAQKEHKMKIYIKIVLLTFLYIIYSCTKDEENQNYQVCENLISKTPDDDLVTNDKKNKAENLLSSKSIEFTNLQITEVEIDELGNYYIRCNQFINGLEVFSHPIGFDFNNNNQDISIKGHLISSVQLNNQSNLDTNILPNLFLSKVDDDSFNLPIIEYSRKNCLDIQFGYLDPKATAFEEPTNFVKAWKITPEDKDFPLLYVNDDSSEIIYYDKGFME